MSNTATDDHHVHVLPLKVYLGIGGILLFLTLVTVWASYIDLGNFNIVLAMAIAVFKASLVALYFMHLKYDNKLYLFAFLTSIFMLATLLVITLFDTLRRDDIYDIEAGEINKESQMYGEIRKGEKKDH